MRPVRRLRPLAVLTILFASLRPALAEEPGPVLTLQIDNDFFSQGLGIVADRDYTTGLRLAWLSAPFGAPDWMKAVTDLPPVFGTPGNNIGYRWGLSLNQNIYTPQDVETSEPVLDDRPYAAWLYLGLTLQAIHRLDDEPLRMDTFDLALGVVGPAAMGKQLQNSFHRALGQPESEGWDHQLKNEPAINLTYERRWRTDAWEPFPTLGLEFDALPYVGGALGNVQTYGSVGSMVRMGRNLRNDFGPPRTRPGLPGSESFTGEGFSWYLFAGLEAQAVARNIFLDGNTFQSSHSVDSRVLVGEAQAGLVLFIDGVRIAYTQVLRTPEFHEQSRFQTYGSVSVSVSF